MESNCKCGYCNKSIHRRPSHIKKSKFNFCDKACQGLFQKKTIIVNCKHCNKECMKIPSEINRAKAIFCSKKCSTIYANLIDGRSTYRKKALSYYNHVCSNPQCPLIINKIPTPLKLLDVDHIDGNRSNNSLDNLRILCVVCHTLVTRKKH